MTGAVGLFERLSKYRLTKRAYAAVFVFSFLFVSFFFAWRDQLNSNRNSEAKIDEIQSILSKLKGDADTLKQLTADQTIVQIIAIALSNNTARPFQASAPISVNFAWANTGALRAHNAYIRGYAGFVGIGNPKQVEQDIDSLYGHVYTEILDAMKQGTKGFVIDPGNPQKRFFSVTANPSEEDVRSFEQNEKGLAYAIRIEYNETMWYERCGVLLRDDLRHSTPSTSEIWHDCPSHNESGTHPLGRLF